MCGHRGQKKNILCVQTKDPVPLILRDMASSSPSRSDYPSAAQNLRGGTAIQDVMKRVEKSRRRTPIRSDAALTESEIAKLPRDVQQIARKMTSLALDLADARSILKDHRASGSQLLGDILTNAEKLVDDCSTEYDVATKERLKPCPGDDWNCVPTGVAYVRRDDGGKAIDLGQCIIPSQLVKRIADKRDELDRDAAGNIRRKHDAILGMYKTLTGILAETSAAACDALTTRAACLSPYAAQRCVFTAQKTGTDENQPDPKKRETLEYPSIKEDADYYDKTREQHPSPDDIGRCTAAVGTSLSIYEKALAEQRKLKFKAQTIRAKLNDPMLIRYVQGASSGGIGDSALGNSKRKEYNAVLTEQTRVGERLERLEKEMKRAEAEIHQNVYRYQLAQRLDATCQSRLAREDTIDQCSYDLDQGETKDGDTTYMGCGVWDSRDGKYLKSTDMDKLDTRLAIAADRFQCRSVPAQNVSWRAALDENLKQKGIVNIGLELDPSNISYTKSQELKRLHNILTNPDSPISLLVQLGVLADQIAFAVNYDNRKASVGKEDRQFFEKRYDDDNSMFEQAFTSDDIDNEDIKFNAQGNNNLSGGERTKRTDGIDPILAGAARMTPEDVRLQMYYAQKRSGVKGNSQRSSGAARQIMFNGLSQRIIETYNNMPEVSAADKLEFNEASAQVAAMLSAKDVGENAQALNPRQMFLNEVQRIAAAVDIPQDNDGNKTEFMNLIKNTEERLPADEHSSKMFLPGVMIKAWTAKDGYKNWYDSLVYVAGRSVVRGSGRRQYGRIAVTALPKYIMENDVDLKETIREYDTWLGLLGKTLRRAQGSWTRGFGGFYFMPGELLTTYVANGSDLSAVNMWKTKGKGLRFTHIYQHDDDDQGEEEFQVHSAEIKGKLMGGELVSTGDINEFQSRLASLQESSKRTGLAARQVDLIMADLAGTVRKIIAELMGKYDSLTNTKLSIHQRGEFGNAFKDSGNQVSQLALILPLIAMFGIENLATYDGNTKTYIINLDTLAAGPFYVETTAGNVVPGEVDANAGPPKTLKEAKNPTETAVPGYKILVTDGATTYAFPFTKDANTGNLADDTTAKPISWAFLNKYAFDPVSNKKVPENLATRTDAWAAQYRSSIAWGSSFFSSGTDNELSQETTALAKKLQYYAEALPRLNFTSSKDGSASSWSTFKYDQTQEALSELMFSGYSSLNTFYKGDTNPYSVVTPGFIDDVPFLRLSWDILSQAQDPERFKYVTGDVNFLTVESWVPWYKNLQDANANAAGSKQVLKPIEAQLLRCTEGMIVKYVAAIRTAAFPGTAAKGADKGVVGNFFIENTALTDRVTVQANLTKVKQTSIADFEEELTGTFKALIEAKFVDLFTANATIDWSGKKLLEDTTTTPKVTADMASFKIAKTVMYAIYFSGLWNVGMRNILEIVAKSQSKYVATYIRALDMAIAKTIIAQKLNANLGIFIYKQDYPASDLRRRVFLEAKRAQQREVKKSSGFFKAFSRAVYPHFVNGLDELDEFEAEEAEYDDMYNDMYNDELQSNDIALRGGGQAYANQNDGDIAQMTPEELIKLYEEDEEDVPSEFRRNVAQPQRELSEEDESSVDEEDESVDDASSTASTASTASSDLSGGAGRTRAEVGGVTTGSCSEHERCFVKSSKLPSTARAEIVMESFRLAYILLEDFLARVTGSSGQFDDIYFGLKEEQFENAKFQQYLRREFAFLADPMSVWRPGQNLGILKKDNRGNHHSQMNTPLVAKIDVLKTSWATKGAPTTKPTSVTDNVIANDQWFGADERPLFKAVYEGFQSARLDRRITRVFHQVFNLGMFSPVWFDSKVAAAFPDFTSIDMDAERVLDSLKTLNTGDGKLGELMESLQGVHVQKSPYEHYGTDANKDFAAIDPPTTTTKTPATARGKILAGTYLPNTFGTKAPTELPNFYAAVTQTLYKMDIFALEDYVDFKDPHTRLGVLSTAGEAQLAKIQAHETKIEVDRMADWVALAKTNATTTGLRKGDSNWSYVINPVFIMQLVIFKAKEDYERKNSGISGGGRPAPGPSGGGGMVDRYAPRAAKKEVQWKDKEDRNVAQPQRELRAHEAEEDAQRELRSHEAEEELRSQAEADEEADEAEDMNSEAQWQSELNNLIQRLKAEEEDEFEGDDGHGDTMPGDDVTSVDTLS